MCGRIVSVGFYEGPGTPLQLGAEWLHNRLEMICPMPEWGNPMRQHPRWTLRRLRDTVVEALRRGQVSGQEICGPTVSLDEAPAQIHAVYKDSRPGLTSFTFDPSASTAPTTMLPANPGEQAVALGSATNRRL